MKGKFGFGAFWGTFLSLLFLSSASFAQMGDIDYYVNQWGELRTAAFNGRGAIVFRDGMKFSSSNIPSACLEALKKKIGEGYKIKDIVVTPAGRWGFIYVNDRGGMEGVYLGGNMFASLSKKIDEFIDDGEEIECIAVNDNEDWFVLSSNDRWSLYCTDGPARVDMLKSRKEKYGQLLYVHFSESVLLFRFATGYTWFGDLPTNVDEAIDNCTFPIQKIKFLDNGRFFFADGKGKFMSNFIGQTSSAPSSPSSSSSSSGSVVGRRICPHCGGAGFTICPGCNGGGKVTRYYPGGSTMITCPSCGGQPRIPCATCGGTGTILQ